LAVAFLAVSPVDTSPVRVIPAAPRAFRVRLGVIARDRLVLPKQSAEPGTTSGPITIGPIV
jgi:hypothetical protein